MRAATAPVVCGAGRMAAWRLHAYGGELRLEPARVPPLRAPDHVLLRVHHASVNPLDVAMIGGYGRRILSTLRTLEAGSGCVEFPLVLGRDFVGRVERSGAAARHRPGELVWGVLPPHWAGAHAQFAVARDCWLGAAPERLGAAAGGALYAGLTATSALRAAGLDAGSGRARGRRVLLLGLGAVGHAVLQLLAYDGAQVVVGCAGELSERALAAGAHTALDRHAADYSESLVACGPYEAIVDCAGLGGGEAGRRAWKFARYVTLSSPLLRETDARGLAAGAAAAALQLARDCTAAARSQPRAALSPPHVRWAYFTPSPEDIKLLHRRVTDGQLEVAVERSFPWWEGEAAYARQAAGHARGKLLLDFTLERPHL